MYTKLVYMACSSIKRELVNPLYIAKGDYHKMIEYRIVVPT